jgi:hypothetical protein
MNPLQYAAFIDLAVTHLASGGDLDQWARKHGRLSKAEQRLIRERVTPRPTRKAA